MNTEETFAAFVPISTLFPDAADAFTVGSNWRHNYWYSGRGGAARGSSIVLVGVMVLT